MKSCMVGYVRMGAVKVSLCLINHRTFKTYGGWGVEDINGRIHALAFLSMG